MEWFKKVVFHNYANFKGRARRKEYWMFYLFYMLFISLATIADMVVFDVNVEDPESFSPLQSIFILAMLTPMISVGARRLHDVGKSGWLQLISLIPFIGAIVLLVFVCKDSDPLENKYGTSPKLITSSTDVENLKISVDGVAESHQKQTKVSLSQDENVTKVFCTQCGEPNTKDNSFCVKCGKALT